MRNRAPSRRLAWILALGALVASCADAPRDPVALLVAPEARAALEVGSALPALPDLIQRVSPGGVAGPELAQAQALWSEAVQEADRGKAAGLRESAYALAAPELAAAMDSAALAGTQARLERWIALASGALRQAELRDLSAAMTDAQDLLTSARAAGERGDRSAAIVLTLRASDRLAETTPRAVAARLAADDESALALLRQAAARPAGDDGRRLERIDRLVSGAREALTAGRYELAIRRAFYARQLLATEGAPSGGRAQ